MLSSIPVEVRNTLDPGDDAEITVISEGGATIAPSGQAIDAPPMVSSGMTRSSSSRVIYASGAGGSVSYEEGGVFSFKSSSDLEDSTSAPGGGRAPSPPSGAFASLLAACGSPSSARTPAQAFAVSSASTAPAKILAVARRKGVTLVTLSTYSMWGTSGFLSRVFAPFATAGISVDLIATSQYAVSLTLDHIPDGVHGDVFRRVLQGAVCA